jgi:hypothetical protein
MSKPFTTIQTVDLSNVTGGKRKETDLEKGVRAGMAGQKAADMAKKIHRSLTGK